MNNRTFIRTALFFLMVTIIASCGTTMSKKQAGSVLEEPLELEPAINATIAEFFNNPEIFDNKSVAVGSFLNKEKKLSKLSLFFINEFGKALTKKAATSDFSVLKKPELAKLLKTWGIGFAGLKSNTDHIQAGVLLGVDFFISGKYTIKEDIATMQLNLIDTKTKKVIAKSKKRVILDDDTLEKNVKYYASNMTVAKATSKSKGVDGEIKLELWAEKDNYKAGETIRFFAKANKSCYLSIVEVDAHGKISVLFPNYYTTYSFIKADKVYPIPSKKSGYEYIADKPLGIKIARGIASATPFIGIATDKGSIMKKKRHSAITRTKPVNKENPFASFLVKAGVFTKGIIEEAKKANKGEWAEAVIKLKITKE